MEDSSDFFKCFLFFIYFYYYLRRFLSVVSVSQFWSRNRFWVFLILRKFLLGHCLGAFWAWKSRFCWWRPGWVFFIADSGSIEGLGVLCCEEFSKVNVLGGWCSFEASLDNYTSVSLTLWERSLKIKPQCVAFSVYWFLKVGG